MGRFHTYASGCHVLGLSVRPVAKSLIAYCGQGAEECSYADQRRCILPVGGVEAVDLMPTVPLQVVDIVDLVDADN